MKAATNPTRRSLLAAGACLAAWPLAGRAAQARARVQEARALMGTRVQVAVQGPDAASLRVAVDAAFARMAMLAGLLSHYEPTSRVAAIGLASGLVPVEVEPEVMQVLRMAQQVARQTHGAFDATIGSLGTWRFDAARPEIPDAAQLARRLPSVDWRQLVLDERRGTAFLARRGMRLDLGGIAKLPILQAGLDTLRLHGVASALLDGGGDVLTLSARGDTPWRVGIRNPRAPQRLLAALDVRNGFVASSGDYERFVVQDGRRWHHVLDPRTGRPAEGLHGVTLVAETLQGVNGLGAAAMVLGPREGGELLRRTAGTEALLVPRHGPVQVSEALRERLRPA